MFINLVKSLAAIAVTPVTLLNDIVHLPQSAYYNADPLERTKRMLGKSADAFNEAIKSEHAK